MTSSRTEVSVALKEWASVCHALETGRQIVLLRKGGISETGGDFHVEHEQFLLYPTFAHQNERFIRPEYRTLAALTDAAREGGRITIRSFARVHRVIFATDPARLRSLESEHIWNCDYIEMRLNYKPDKPLYVLLLRTYLLSYPVSFTEKTEYVGCRSWVELDETADLAGATPALDDAAFQARCVPFESAFAGVPSQ